MADNEDAISIEVHVESCANLTINEIWPDGDQPETVTADAIRRIMEAEGSRRQVIEDWLIVQDGDVTVTVTRRNPHWHGDQTLIDEPPPQWLHETAKPWDLPAPRKQEKA